MKKQGLRRLCVSVLVPAACAVGLLVGAASAAQVNTCGSPILKASDLQNCLQANLAFVGSALFHANVTNTLGRANGARGIVTDGRRADQTRITGCSIQNLNVGTTKQDTTGCQQVEFHQTFVVP